MKITLESMDEYNSKLSIHLSFIVDLINHLTIIKLNPMNALL